MTAGQRETVLVTGATGLLGAAVIARMLRDEPGVRIAALVRDSARWDALAASLGATGGRVSPIYGDVTQRGLGIDAAARATLEHTARSVVHLAADTSFSRSLPRARAVNVEGTRHALELAESWGRDARFVHVSTAFVAGRRTGVIRECATCATTDWVNAYEQSKYEAERLVQQSGLAWIIARPSTVVCDTGAGGITQVNAVHRSLHLLYRGLAPMLPADADSLVDLVTTEYVAAAIVALRRDPLAEESVFHLCAGDRAISLGDLLDLAFDSWSSNSDWRRRRIERPALTDLATYELFERTVDDVAAPSLKRITRALSCFVPQLALSKRFETTGADRRLGFRAPAVRQFWPAVVTEIARRAQ
ncbi:MAG: SDR family oxidoreductase [Gemmatimonadota bacterium]|nr:SDR family oxidoreductase [Gemmatimonadota bacterium]